MSEPVYVTMELFIERHASDYYVSLSHRDPTNDAIVAPSRGPTPLDPEALLALQSDPETYGNTLSSALFADGAVSQRFAAIEAVAGSTEAMVRLTIHIDDSAQELSSLRWELMRHPIRQELLATSERWLVSRFIVSRDWKPVKVRAQSALVALVAVSAPPADQLAKRDLAPVDYEGEVGRVRTALSNITVKTLGGPGDPLTLDRLVEELRSGVDILYLVAHGAFSRSTGVPAVLLQDADGSMKIVRGEELATRIGQLQVGPRLVVMASCESAGDGGSDSERSQTAQSTLAARMADAGVAAVLAMQGLITMATIETMMPVFFTELLRDGQIDRALAAARGTVAKRADAWMPALFMRLRNGKIWYTPGFRGDGHEDTWRRLLKPIAEGKVVPILGNGMLDHVTGGIYQTARQLADAHNFPLADHEWDDLPRVTQFLTVKQSRFNVVREVQGQLAKDIVALSPDLVEGDKTPRLGKLLGLVSERIQNTPNDPYRILGELPASVYLTTNLVPLMGRSLAAAGKTPTRVVSRWRYQSRPAPPFDNAHNPSTTKPLVFHALGAFGKDNDDTLVLTEDDYFDYLIGTASDQLMPCSVESALVDNSLLFLGFRLTDWSFRVLFRLIMSLPGRERLKQYSHVAVQVDPDLHSMADIEGAKVYLSEYFGQEANIAIYWGSASDFLLQLRTELEQAGTYDEDDDDGGDDEWDF